MACAQLAPGARSGSGALARAALRSCSSLIFASSCALRCGDVSSCALKRSMRTSIAFSSSARSSGPGASCSGPFPRCTSSRKRLCPCPSTASSGGGPASLRFGSVAGSSSRPNTTKSTPAACAAGRSACAAVKVLSLRGWSSSTTMRAPSSRRPLARAAITRAGSGSKPAAKRPTLMPPASASSVARTPGAGSKPASRSGTPCAVSTRKLGPSARSRCPTARAAAWRSASPCASTCAFIRRWVRSCLGGAAGHSKSKSPASTKSSDGSWARSFSTSATARGRPPR